MKTFLLRFFTWWNGQTFGTQLWTARFGALVGEDEFGNRYYRTKGGKIDPMLGFERRWVIYNGVAEASCVPPTWHGWLHHTVDELPTEEQVTPRSWWKPHRPNLTGTPGAHRPTGSTLAQGRRPRATGDAPNLGAPPAWDGSQGLRPWAAPVPDCRHALPPPHSAC
jgi:NADH:ubiquinone oxidoreductase subunit